MSKTLTPPSSTRLERVAARVCASLGEVRVPLRQLWDPCTCPVDLLPYLAWAFSVDRWDENWSAATKRSVIASSFFIHLHKGTINVLRAVISPLGSLTGVSEWFESGSVPGTFGVSIRIGNKGLSADAYLELERLIDDAKPCSRHLTGVSLVQEVKGDAWVGVGCYVGDSLTVYAYMPDEIITAADAHIGGAVLLIDNVSFKL